MSIDTDAGWDAYLRDSDDLHTSELAGPPERTGRATASDAVAALIATILVTGFLAIILIAYLPGGAQ